MVVVIEFHGHVGDALFLERDDRGTGQEMRAVGHGPQAEHQRRRVGAAVHFQVTLSDAVTDDAFLGAIAELGPKVPAVSTWGVIVMLLLVLTLGSILFRRSTAIAAWGDPCPEE